MNQLFEVLLNQSGCNGVQNPPNLDGNADFGELRGLCTGFSAEDHEKMPTEPNNLVA
jgi:hypothetical protein